MVLDPLLLWVGTDVLVQLGFEAVDREAPAQLEGALGGSTQEVDLLPGGGKGVAGRGLWTQSLSVPPGGGWPGHQSLRQGVGRSLQEPAVAPHWLSRGLL